MRHDPASGAIIIMLRSLKMHGMAQAVGELTEQSSPAFEAAVPILSQLLKAETADREVRSTAYQLKAARFPNYRERAPLFASRISASGELGLGPKCTKRRAPLRKAWSGSALSEARPSPSWALIAPRLYWSITAAQMIGAIPVPVYADAVAEEIAAVLDHSGAGIVIAQDQEQIDKILSVRDRLPKLAHLLHDEMRGLNDYDEPGLEALSAVAVKGRAALADPAVARELDRRIDAGRGSDPSVILYTSGTTGRSKGVVLSGERSIRAARHTVAFDRLTDRDEALAYLPLAWVGDHYLNYAQGYVAGFCIACPESAETAANDLREIGPTYHFAPPRVFEALLTRVQIRMEDASAVKRWLYRVFMDVAKRWGERIANAEPVPVGARLAYRLGDLMIYAPLKDALGFSRVRVAYTAGEAIGADLFAFYRSIGLNLKQLYGQTEAFLFVTAQTDRAVRSDAVGPPAPNVELRIAESGEVQFKSPGMFVGYFREDDKTRETMTDDGYVKTGDAGFFDPDGQLKIIDRAKDIGRLRNGQMFAPKYIENKLKFFPEIREAVTFGDGRRFRCGHDQYRTGFGRPLGRAQRHRLRVLPGARRKRPSLRHDRKARRRGQSRAKPGAGHGWRADQALLDLAQGARP